jgi:hypothetical protein
MARAPRLPDMLYATALSPPNRTCGSQAVCSPVSRSALQNGPAVGRSVPCERRGRKGSSKTRPPDRCLCNGLACGGHPLSRLARCAHACTEVHVQDLALKLGTIAPGMLPVHLRQWTRPRGGQLDDGHPVRHAHGNRTAQTRSPRGALRPWQTQHRTGSRVGGAFLPSTSGHLQVRHRSALTGRHHQAGRTRARVAQTVGG